jgi:peptide/nickel transport system permease protein
MDSRDGKRRAFIGGLLLATLAIASLLTTGLDAHAPLVKDIAAGLDIAGMPLPPSLAYPLGTDSLGRCIASRLAHGAPLTLLVAGTGTLIAVCLGVLIGFVAGFVGGWLDTVLMRVTDAVLSFPLLLLGVAAAAALRGRAGGIGPAIVVLGFVGWPSITRVVRARVRVLRQEGYVEAAHALGSKPIRIAWRHIMPGLAGQIIVLAALSVPQMILAESTLSFLGLGAPAPLPAWGRMLAEGQAHLRTAPWITLGPGISLVLLSLGFGLVGEGLRDVYRTEGSR